MVKSKIFGKSSLSFSFGQGSYLISDFAEPKSVKAVLLQVSLRSEIIIFNNNFVFCQASFLKLFMISFCNMSSVAGWFSVREIVKPTSVFRLVCLKRYNKVLTEVWQDKNTKKNIKEIEEHEINNTLHIGLSVVPKTHSDSYDSISIGEYIIAFTCFLHCTKKCRVVENIENEAATWKIVIEKISTLKW